MTAETVVFTVPSEYRTMLPGAEPVVSFCPRTLVLEPASDPPEKPAFALLPEAFPDKPDAAISLMLLIGLLDELALYRTELTALLADVEQAGVDPFLVFSRLARDPTVEPVVDLDRRQSQLEQLL